MSEMGSGVIEMAFFYTLLIIIAMIFFFVFTQLFRKKKGTFRMRKNICFLGPFCYAQQLRYSACLIG